MIAIFKIIYKLIKEEKGQGLVEYALILIFVSLAAIIAMTNLGDKVAVVMNDTVNSFPD